MPRAAAGRRARTGRRARWSSVALELRPALLHERLVGALEVARLHAHRLRLSLGLYGRVEAHVPLLVEHRLGHRVRERRAAGELARQLARLDLQRLGRDQAVEEAAALGLLGPERAAG